MPLTSTSTEATCTDHWRTLKGQKMIIEKVASWLGSKHDWIVIPSFVRS